MPTQSEIDTSTPPPSHGKRWHDAIAGLSLAGLLLPQALAYSSIGNMPPQAGIFALFAGLLCYGLFGSSRFAIVSATSSSAIVLAAATASLAHDDVNLRMMMAMGLVTITGIFFLIAAMARLGKITDFIAKPVLRGFTFGLAIVIILKQCANVVGATAVQGNAFNIIAQLLNQVGSWHLPSIAVACASLALLYVLERVKYIPGGVLVIVIGVISAHWLGLADYGVSLFGVVELELAAPTVPHLPPSEWLRLGELSFALLFVLYAESYGSIRNFAIKHNDPVAPNRDLFALGVANVISGLLRGMPVGAGYSATSANEKHGATSRFAGLSAAVVVLGIVLTAMPGIALIPKPVLAAIVIHAVSHTLMPTAFYAYFEWRRDRLVIIASVIAVLALGVLDGLLVSIGISLFLMLRQMSSSSVSQMGQHGRREHDFVNMRVFPKASAIPGILILRPDQTLFFANADRIMTEIHQIIAASDSTVHGIIISLEQTPDLDGTSLEAIHEFVGSLEKTGAKLVLARVKNEAYEALERAVMQDFPDLIVSRLSVSHAVNVLQAHEEPIHAEKPEQEEERRQKERRH